MNQELKVSDSEKISMSPKRKNENIKSDHHYEKKLPSFTSEDPGIPLPLTWESVRIDLMNYVSSYEDSTRTKKDLNPENSEEEFCRRVLNRLKADGDKWMAVFFSIVLFTLGLISFFTAKRSSNNLTSAQTHNLKLRSSTSLRYDPFISDSDPFINFYVELLVAGFIALSSCFLSNYMLWQRNVISNVNRDAGLKESVNSFASYLTKIYSTSNDSGKKDSRYKTKNIPPKTTKLSGGTSLTDIYPVYRRNNDADPIQNKNEGTWHRVPKLLLVRGDYIALQVGDTTPAASELICNKNEAKILHNQLSNSPSLTIKGGERITLDVMNHITQNEDSSKRSNFAQKNQTAKKNARVVLDEESTQLLAFNNGMKLFILKETPLQLFLERIRNINHKTPQIYRQIQAIRKCLITGSSIMFFLSTTIIIVRILIMPNYELSMLLHLPFYAALGILPVNFFVIFILESIGTARILTFIHPFTSQHSLQNYNPQSSKHRKHLFIKYYFSTISSRFLSSNNFFSFLFRNPCNSDNESSLLPIPPANTYFLEKLGVVTALALIDDELACEPHSTPQQLLIPSENGLKLLDLYPSHGEDDSDSDGTRNHSSRRKRGLSINSVEQDADSDDTDLDLEAVPSSTVSNARKKLLGFKRKRNRKRLLTSNGLTSEDLEHTLLVQFEDPSWWKFLPSLKCIGLGCMLVDYNPRRKKNLYQLQSLHEKQSKSNKSLISDENNKHFSSSQSTAQIQKGFNLTKIGQSFLKYAEKSLVKHICTDQSRSQFLALAQCIGFSDDQKTGDLALFKERRRLHIVSTKSVQNRMSLDTHALGLEESRLWDVLRPDSTSVIIQDRRSKAYQLLTVGDAKTVIALCADAWQGENSTISPLSVVDRKMILDTCCNWSLADLDVAAFSYAPVPYTLEQRIGGAPAKGFELKTTAYLVDHLSNSDNVSHVGKGVTSSDWSLISNQIFLGMLGSAVSPRKEIAPMIEQCTSAGVRFVYFSPRNMRRTKELASQMGIDVAWNCAISLRALDEGEEDPHRMKSTYADWDVNARLPHGIENVRKHLEEVDNVPLLVSLYTDVTEDSTIDMVNIFRKYHDTVITLGLSHRSRNERTFSVSDLSIGVDVISQEINQDLSHDKGAQKFEATFSTASVLPDEIDFVSSIVSHSCVFNLRGCSTMTFLPEIFSIGRSALESTTAAGLFMINGGLSLSLLILFCPFFISSYVPIIPPIGSVLYLLIILPISGISIALCDTDSESIARVPTKNDETQIFAGRDEFKRLYKYALLRSLSPAILSHLTHYIAFRELINFFDPTVIDEDCSESKSLYFCESLTNYRGVASKSAGILLLAQMTVCVVFASVGFVHRTQSIVKEFLMRNSQVWAFGMLLNVFFIFLFLLITLDDGVLGALPWNFYLSFTVTPFICIGFGEWIKVYDHKHEKRDAAFRRLKFETRLGMWSPK